MLLAHVLSGQHALSVLDTPPTMEDAHGDAGVGIDALPAEELAFIDNLYAWSEELSEAELDALYARHREDCRRCEAAARLTSARPFRKMGTDELLAIVGDAIPVSAYPEGTAGAVAEGDDLVASAVAELLRRGAPANAA